MHSLLIVDDQPHIVRVLKSSMSRNGYEVRTAANGEQALASVKSQKPDFIMTDIEMPRMNGMELCEKLYAEYGDSMPQTLIISGHYSPSMDSWLEQFSHRVSFYEKPVSLSRMVEILSKLQE